MGLPTYLPCQNLTVYTCFEIWSTYFCTCKDLIITRVTRLGYFWNVFLQKKAKYLGNFWANLMKDTFEIKTDVATLWATLLKIWHFFFHQVSLIIASSSQIFCLEVRCNWVQPKFCSLLIFFTLTQWEQIGRFLRCFGVKLVAEMYDDFLA